MVRKLRKRHSHNNIPITICIYGLLSYIVISAGLTFVKSVISQNYLVQTFKSMTKENIPLVHYLSEDEKKENEDRKISDTLSRMVDSPVLSYANSKNNFTIAERVNTSYITTENNLDDYTGGLEGENVLFNYEGNSVNNSTENKNPETTTQPPTNGESVNTVSPNVSFQKLRDIGVNQLSYDFLIKNYYTVVKATTLYPSDIDANKLMNIDMALATPNSQPQILIYHTHGQEGFADSTPGDPNTGVIGVGNYLTQLLTQQYGYNVIHITDSFDYVNGVLDRNKAYDYAYNRIAQVLTENPSVEVVIDLHRDGVNENLHLVTDINGKPTAQIMFFNGLSRLNSIGEIGYLYNPYREQNLALSMQLKVKSEEYFDSFTRKNYIQAYEYNMSLRPKSLLIECGAQTNSFQEELNAMEPLAELLHQVLK